MGSSLTLPDVQLSPDKTVIVTGANTGIGYETAKLIAQMGARVIIGCRSQEKAETAIKRMQKEHSEEKTAREIPDNQVSELNVEYMNLDLSSLTNTMAFVEAFKAKGYPLHLLICNAGLIFDPQDLTEDGFELHFQVNYLAHFLMILHLLPVMKTSGSKCRIVLVVSKAYAYARWNENDLQYKNALNEKLWIYCNTKLYMVMLMFSLCQRLGESSNVSVFGVYPGTVKSEIMARGQTLGVIMSTFKAVHETFHLYRTIREGALYLVTAALDPKYDDQTALYFHRSYLKTPSALARDAEKQEFLWKYSLECLKDYIQEDTLDVLTSS